LYRTTETTPRGCLDRQGQPPRQPMMLCCDHKNAGLVMSYARISRILLGLAGTGACAQEGGRGGGAGSALFSLAFFPHALIAPASPASNYSCVQAGGVSEQHSGRARAPASMQAPAHPASRAYFSVSLFEGGNRVKKSFKMNTFYLMKGGQSI
jgi:hypothetical protein